MLTKIFRPVVDLVITLLLWAYFFAAFLFFFFPAYAAAALYARDREAAFQSLNCRFYRGFFFYLRLMMPGVKISIAPEVYAVRSSVIIANHLSFLDPILFLSLFKRHKTIVKSIFFKVPVFGWILKSAGYLCPALTQDSDTADLMDEVKNMQAYLATGGNLFIFPEGTRSRSGSIATFEKGAFSIAKLSRAPICVVRIENTHHVYQPDRFFFITGKSVEIKISLAGSIEPDYATNAVSVTNLMQQARDLLEGNR